MTQPAIAIVLTTVPDDFDVEFFARALVDARLAACVSALPPMTSFYRWEGACQRGAERQLIIKTIASHLDALEQKIKDLHPYDLPEFLVVSALPRQDAYGGWIAESTV